MRMGYDRPPRRDGARQREPRPSSPARPARERNPDRPIERQQHGVIVLGPHRPLPTRVLPGWHHHCMGLRCPRTSTAQRSRSAWRWIVRRVEQ